MTPEFDKSVKECFDIAYNTGIDRAIDVIKEIHKNQGYWHFTVREIVLILTEQKAKSHETLTHPASQDKQ